VDNNMRSGVLIIGAGPTGLVLALWLSKLGIPVRIVDKAPAPSAASRALVVQARTLELYRQLGLADAVIERGHRVFGLNFWANGKQKARLPLDDLGAPITPYQFIHIFPQDAHERLLIERLAGFGVRVERALELIDWAETEGGVEARLRNPQGGMEIAEAAYIVGCDGAHSTLRKQTGVEFTGGAYRQLFYVADVEGEGPALNGEIHVDLDESDFVAVFGIDNDGRARLVGSVREDRLAGKAPGVELQFSDVSERILAQMGLTIRKVNWFSTYHVHHRVAARFRFGRAFMAGDAAHVHSPVGGQGMNTGIGDAINLAWKLAAVLEGRADDSLLDSYDAERRAFARKLVATTDRMFTMATSDSSLAHFGRTRMMPLAARMLAQVETGRAYLFRVMSQTLLNYRGSPLSAGSRHGQVRAGDRLPWVKTAGADNYDTLEAIEWQVHAYGEPPETLVRCCARHGLALSVFAWDPAHGAAGIGRDTVYLLRPDGHIALIVAPSDPGTIDAYFRRHGIGTATVSEPCTDLSIHEKGEKNVQRLRSTD
jgi:2-polyprenyl-6-methoxyphenol hydroxylase-like FAD-dependent oxidoreductase